MAPPIPWIARATIKTPMLGARAASADPSRENADPHEKHALAPEAVAEGGAGEQEHGEGQGVGIDRPLQPLEACSKFCLDNR